jgi:drug/metabolite transporter (DMT)-like permease
MRRSDIVGSLYASVAMILMGSSVAVSSVIRHYPALGGQAVRYALSAVALGVLLRARGRVPRPTLPGIALLLALALTGLVGFNLFLLAALGHADPAAVGVIVGCIPIALALVGPLAEGGRPQGRILWAAAIVSAGAAVVQGAGTASVPGVLLSLGVLVCEVAFSLLAVPLLPRLGPVALSAYVTAVASVMLVLAAAVVDRGGALPPPTAAQAAVIGYLGLAATTCAFVAWYAGIELMGPTRTGLFAGLAPISTLVCAVALGMEGLTPMRGLGVLVVGAGVTFGMSRPPDPLDHTALKPDRSAA